MARASLAQIQRARKAEAERARANALSLKITTASRKPIPPATRKHVETAAFHRQQAALRAESARVQAAKAQQLAPAVVAVKHPTRATPAAPKIEPKLSPKTIVAQQALSDKFGIVTFGLKGDISTVPTVSSGGFSDINVGTGKFKTFDEFANRAVEIQVKQNESSKTPSDTVTVADPRFTTRQFESTDKGFVETTGEGITDKITSTITKNPIIAIGAALLLGAVVFSGGKRR